MLVMRYVELVALAFLVQFASPENVCHHTTVVPGYRPSVTKAVVRTAKITKSVSVDECSRLCCVEACSVAYVRDQKCVRLTCHDDDAKCTFTKSAFANTFLVLPARSERDSIPCSFDTATGCGLNEQCSQESRCECNAASRLSKSGVCMPVMASSVARVVRGDDVVTQGPAGHQPASPTASAAANVTVAAKTSATPIVTAEQTSATPIVTAEQTSATPIVTAEQTSGPLAEATSAEAQSTPIATTLSVSQSTVSSMSPSKSAVPIQAVTSHPVTGPAQENPTRSPDQQQQKSSNSSDASKTIATVPSESEASTTTVGPTSTQPLSTVGVSSSSATTVSVTTTLNASLHVTTVPAAGATTGAALPTVPQPAVIRVITAGKDRVITLPENTVTVFTTIIPHPQSEDENKFEYEWMFVSGPNGGQIDNPHSSSAVLSELVVGVYQVHLKVKGPDRRVYQDGINITVLPVPRVNVPPKAIVNHPSFTVQYPESSVVLDASQSHDEYDTTLTYRWIEVSWPIGRHLKDYDDTDRSVLKLHDLKVGDYELKLIVSDSDGAEDSALVNITVLPERDDPPVAHAGEPQVIQLPASSVWLNGNGSSDDKGIVSYIWKKLKGPAGNDQSGSSTPYLHLTNLVAGDYVFELTVTDKSDQKAVKTVSVLVKPANDKPPHVDAGNDMSSVARSIDLVARAWMEEEENGCLECTYRWVKSSAPVNDKSRLFGNTTLTLHVDQMIAGQYVFTFTAASSQGKSASSSVTLTIQNAADVDKPPTANAGSDVTIRLPNHMAMLDGSQSTDSDDEISRWRWTRLTTSPAVGDIANGSDHASALKLSNLVEGTYTFMLKVSDTFGKASTDLAMVHVLPAAESLRESLFEIEIKESASEFTENEKNILLNSVANALGYAASSAVDVYAIDSRLGRVTIVLRVMDAKEDWSALAAVKQLRKSQQMLNLDVKESSVTVERINTYYCLNNCSYHGECEPLSKQCICDTLWMQNPFRAHFGQKVSNCDWNLLYVAMVNMAMLAATVGLCYCCFRIYGRCTVNRIKLRARGQKGYAVLKKANSDEDTSIPMLPKVSGRGDINDISDSEDLLFDTSSMMKANSRLKTSASNGHHPANGKALRSST